MQTMIIKVLQAQMRQRQAYVPLQQVTLVTALGADATATSDKGTALGYTAKVTKDDGVALGSNSVANTEGWRSWL